MNNITYLYIIQSATKLPDIYECLRDRNFLLLSFKENTSDTTIFFPKSTWATGRNRLRQYILNMKTVYDYYIFMDSDVVFANYSQVDGFNRFEELIAKYRPYVANPIWEHYYKETEVVLPVEAQTTIWFDGKCNSFSRDALYSNIIFPYMDIFDSRSWRMSQYAMMILCSIYNKEVILFPQIKILNTVHSEYPKSNIMTEVEKYIYNNFNDNSINKSPLKWDKKDLTVVLPKTKCDRTSCNYTKHTSIDNNGGTHCCRACKIDGAHGPACQRMDFTI